MQRLFLGVGCLAATLVVAVASHAEAGVWVEVYTGERPVHAEAMIRPMQTVFEERGYLGGEALAVKMTAISRPGLDDPERDFTQLAQLVELGDRLLSFGQYSMAALRLQRAVDLAKASQALLVRDDANRDLVVRALMGLAIAYRRDSEETADEATSLRRAGQLVEAKQRREESQHKRQLFAQTLEEAVRFSTGEPDVDTYGTQPVQWWKEARARLLSKGTGTLIIDPGDPGVTSFVNGVHVGQGTLEIKLPPGPCHVYSHRADVRGRAYLVEVAAKKVTRLGIGWKFDTFLRTTDRAVWFSLNSPEENRELRAMLAAELKAKMPGQEEVIVVGFATTEDGDQYAYGLTFDAAGKVVASGSTRFGGNGTAQRLMNLARLLTGDRDVVDIDNFDAGLAPTAWVARPLSYDEAPATEVRSTTKTSTTVGAVASSASAAVALGAGVYWLAVDQRCIDMRCQRVTNTKWQGIGAVSVGVLSATAAGYLWGRHRRTERRLLRGHWPWVVGAVSASLVVAGGALIGFDEPAFEVQGEDVVRSYQFHRPLLLPGGIVTTAGALGLGFSIYSAMGADVDGLAPTVSISSEGTVAGLAGRF
jgi:hypothetical protein